MTVHTATSSAEHHVLVEGDVLSFVNSNAGVIFNLGTGFETTPAITTGEGDNGYAEGDTSEYEWHPDAAENLTLRGSDYNDELYAGIVQAASLTVTLEGRDGDDLLDATFIDDTAYLSGGSGDDELVGAFTGTSHLDGGSGHDVMTAQNSVTYMTGDTGNDIYYVVSAANTTVEDVGNGTDSVFSAISWVLDENIENLTLFGGVTGTGNELNNTITGSSGANDLSGEAGTDTVKGEAGADNVNGGADGDYLYDGAGADFVEGDAGLDQIFLTNDADVDRIVFDVASDSAAGSGSRDQVTGFDRGEDLIDLFTIDANTTVAGDQSFTFIGTAGFGGNAGELRYHTAGVVQGDRNGDGISDFEVRMLDNFATMTSSDFIL